MRVKRVVELAQVAMILGTPLKKHEAKTLPPSEAQETQQYWGTTYCRTGNTLDVLKQVYTRRSSSCEVLANSLILSPTGSVDERKAALTEIGVRTLPPTHSCFGDRKSVV